MKLEEKRWSEVEKYLETDDRVILPIGSVEQHGPRGLLGTDALVADAIALEVGKRTDVLVTPDLSFGMAEHHMGFPGTISLLPSTYQRVLRDVLRSLYRHGFRRIMIMNGHGGNIAPVQCALSEVTNELLDLRVQLQSWFMLPGVTKMVQQLYGEREGGHGTPSEVSITMFLKPHVAFVDDVPANGLGDTPIFCNHRMVREKSVTGLFGGSDPNLATAEAGQQIFECAVTETVALMSRWD